MNDRTQLLMRDEHQLRRDPVTRRMKQGFFLFAIVAGFFVVAEHRAHLIPYLPWLLLAACPLMHLFMHHGHGGQQHHGDTGDSGVRSNNRSAFTSPSERACTNHVQGERP